ncbi:hypothetical protein [Streptomyces pini]|uniref:Uncharacterized protein n=1 Tax=Streptomyces pini TaxID=1520580 RepID=A0A1I4EL81_9ACTN|nr:hypothetical protein [Streptomyces pini]SFL04921.1 hypothetical protein SAMN05192584_11270 [Streptomyces pini]
MTTTKAFRPEFRTRDGRKVSFAASYTHDTAAKRRAGLTKAGRPKVATVGAGTIVRRPRRWIPWAVFGANSAAIGGTHAVAELGPVVGGGAAVGVVYVGYKAARWTAGEVAYWSVKLRQIRGRQQVAEEAVPAQRIPADTVAYPDPAR